MDQAITLETCRATEFAAMAAWRKRFLEGCTDKNLLDNAAVSAMHQILSKEFPYNIVAVFGEGEWDGAPRFQKGEQIGTGQGPLIHLGVDPLDGTSNTAAGLPGATSVLALSDENGMLAVPDIIYLRKIAVGPEAKGCISLQQSFADNLHAVAKALHKPPKGLRLYILNRPRNQHFIDVASQYNCQITLINGCDIVPGIVTAHPEGEGEVDLLVGSGGAPEGVLLAAALKCLDGDMCAQFFPEDSGLTPDSPEMAQVPQGHLTLNDLIPGKDVIFSITGVTQNLLTKGIAYNSKNDQIYTDSWLYRSSSGTIRHVEGWRKLSTHPRWSRYANQRSA